MWQIISQKRRACGPHPPWLCLMEQASHLCSGTQWDCFAVLFLWVYNQELWVYSIWACSLSPPVSVVFLTVLHMGGIYITTVGLPNIVCLILVCLVEWVVRELLLSVWVQAWILLWLLCLVLLLLSKKVSFVSDQMVLLCSEGRMLKRSNGIARLQKSSYQKVISCRKNVICNHCFTFILVDKLIQLWSEVICLDSELELYRRLLKVAASYTFTKVS